jgi:hypothetical protein
MLSSYSNRAPVYEHCSILARGTLTAPSCGASARSVSVMRSERKPTVADDPAEQTLATLKG